eukprot:CAMPEP_0194033390 /NCGR_PEP_ID=MMETSP0009_2-20130614/6111_1 /TAXON_ID=210454 /ORGANISM="Grammatophora oceanica, Strain CCMP 410" /LENGTH=484 /DNA_ID=CAMNT_0038674083 /DNA_START=180 /DNA_END=1634 /DNA_ORIENTATION=+
MKSLALAFLLASAGYYGGGVDAFLSPRSPASTATRTRRPWTTTNPEEPPTAGNIPRGFRTASQAPFSKRRTTSSSRRYIGFGSKSGTDRDFYKILGVPRDADKSAIKKGYYAAAKKFHPDRHPNATPEEKAEFTKKFQDINRAKEVLTDDQLREKYDQFGEAGIGTSAMSDEQAKNGFGPGFGGGFGEEVDLGDIFDSFFGGGGGGGFAGGGGGGARTRTRGPIVGDDLRFDLEIDFKTAVFGGEEKVRIRHLEKCGTCDGDGIKPGARVNTCSACGGSGVTIQVTRTPLGNFQTQQTCPQCRGTGQEVEEYCGTCSGQGVVTKSKQIKVTIPPGVEDGNKLRVRSEGDAGPNGGPAGDLYIFLNVKADKTFKREGPEIYSDESISYLDAILGASIKTPTVDGDVTIKVPPGTQPGQVMRLKGTGAPRLGNPTSRGDHYVTMNVEIPNSLSKEEKELMEQLKELREKKAGKGVFGKKKEKKEKK